MNLDCLQIGPYSFQPGVCHRYPVLKTGEFSHREENQVGLKESCLADDWDDSQFREKITAQLGQMS